MPTSTGNQASVTARFSARLNRISRARAFTTHLLISLGIFLVLLALILLAWYPDALFRVDGGWRGLKLIIFVDLVLGPALTLVIFRPGKPGLWFDVLLIATVQLGALFYGVSVVYTQRPVVMVFAEEKFSTAISEQVGRAQQLLKNNGIAAQVPEIGVFSRPKLFAVAETRDREERLAAAARALSGDMPATFLRLDRYRPLTEVLDEVARDSLNMQELVSRSPEDRREYEAFLEKTGRPAEEFYFVHLVPRDERQVVAIDRKTGELAGYLDIRPPN